MGTATGKAIEESQSPQLEMSFNTKLFTRAEIGKAAK